MRFDVMFRESGGRFFQRWRKRAAWPMKVRWKRASKPASTRRSGDNDICRRRAKRGLCIECLLRRLLFLVLLSERLLH